MKFSVVIVAAGRGTRLGISTPKAFVSLGGRPLYMYSVDLFLAHPDTESVVVVAPADYVERVGASLQDRSGRVPVQVVAGGEHRWQSVKNGVDKTPVSTPWVGVHDAARPFVTHQIIDILLDATQKYRAVFTATPEVDTIREFEDDVAGRTLDRSRVVRVGTPQLFHRPTLVQGFELAATLPTPPTDEIMLMEALGIPVGISWGDVRNFKITTPADMEIAEALIQTRGNPRA